MHIAAVLIIFVLLAIVFLTRKRKAPSIETIGSKYEREVNTRDFEEMVIQTSMHTLVMADFYANWCAPCHYLTPLLAEMANEYGGTFLLAKIDTDKNPELKKEYEISAFPTVMLFKDGTVVEKFVGGKLEHTVRFTLAKHGVKQVDGSA